MISMCSGMTVTGLCFWRSTMRARTPVVFTRGQSSYTQGQSPEPRVREYFYYLDHQGQLFLDDTKVKNFVTCFKGMMVERLKQEGTSHSSNDLLKINVKTDDCWTVQALRHAGETPGSSISSVC
ncbi:UPF0598 protein C8orf82 homolog isoform X2 [Tachysurus vachellii]|uniref:UPF0598 protein C8orf82 homolog isoform X2 n=1 Tax=Tachysurus vachellii TaxID=175792 RepID=UPI00296AB1F9|nr:UPF0598 protein C8orf82 homolog isoform X2 [Tachysurus vachellii]